MPELTREFLPFSAINEFMTEEFRHQVIAETLTNQDKLPKDILHDLKQALMQKARIEGFRNSWLAPINLRIRAAEKVFQSDDRFTGTVLRAWAAVHPNLLIQVVAFLGGRGWDVLPAELDRSKLPGFETTWKTGETFDTLCRSFREMYPTELSDDHISLMCVWVSVRLPYKLTE